MDPYIFAKWLHILSSTVLFGTGIGTAFQMVWAMRTRRPQTIRDVATGVVWADWIFTTPAGIVQPLTGLWLVWLSGFDLFEPWLLLTYILYLSAFCCWVPVVVLQLRIRDQADAASQEHLSLSAHTLRLYRVWFALGWPAFLSLIGIYWLMLAKPTLW